ncbi:MAG: hypothetical protein AAGI48_10310 [Verrucomicrobiota bacterium]
MIRLNHIRSVATAALGLLVGAGACLGQSETAELENIIGELQRRNKALEQGIASANRAEKEASEQLAQVRRQLEALGRDLLDGGDERLIEATADIQILNERISRLQDGAMQLSGAVTEYLGTAVAADPDARLRLETAMRELDEVLGLRQKPAPTAQSGTARSGKVMSIDPESGLLVLNIGEQQGTQIGTIYRLRRGDQYYGTAIIADVRRSIAGAFVESLDANQGPVRLGDIAILETE